MWPARFGRLDILVNNAGAFETNTLGGTDFAAVDRLLAVNVGGVIAAIRAAGFADYTASKAVIEGYSRAASRDLAARNITVNTLGIGPVSTDMNSDMGRARNRFRALITDAGA